jgi:hypothetical protein
MQNMAAMPAFNVAWCTRTGTGSPYGDLVLRAPLSHALKELIVLARDSKTSTPTPSSVSLETLFNRLQPYRLKACLSVEIDPVSLILQPEPVLSGMWHYFRLADATLKPLGDRPGPLPFAAGDTYIALSPGVRRVADSADDVRHAIARFLHLRDDFNADKLADALLAHLAELAGVAELPEDITALVIEAR